MADVGASKEMLLHQLNALMADAAGDAETMELYQAKLAELDAARRANADLEQQLQASNQAKENLQRQLASVAQDAKTATDSLHDQLQAALADKVELERHLESVQRELGDVQEAKNSALGDLDRSNQEVDALREELRDMRRRVQAAEDAGSEAQKVLHVMSAEAEASRREQDNLRERVAGVAETLAAVRVAERAAAKFGSHLAQGAEREDNEGIIVAEFLPEDVWETVGEHLAQCRRMASRPVAPVVFSSF